MSKSVSKSSSHLNFEKALKNLKRSLATPVLEPRDSSGIIKDFEMTYELSWKVLKKFLLKAGHETLGAKDVFSRAYQLGYLKNEKGWLEMIEDRNQTSHVYDEKQAGVIVKKVASTYLALFEALFEELERHPDEF